MYIPVAAQQERISKARMEVWRVVVLVAVALTTLVVVVTAEESGQPTLWTDSEAFKLEMEEWITGSPEWMLKNLPLELLDDDRNLLSP